MVLRKIIVWDTFQKLKKINETDIKPKTKKTGSLARKQNKKPSQNNKKILKKIPSGFKYLKWIKKDYF